MDVNDRDLYDGCRLETTASIRLLRIKQDAGEFGSLSCDLCSVDIEQAPAYTALSYTWGVAAGDSNCLNQVLNVNGHTLRITSNLEDALLTLRKLGQKDHLWIDAICINQADNKEKASQVSLMCRIFRTAEEVLVWLGTANNDDIADAAWLHSTFLEHIRKLFGQDFLSSPLSSELTIQMSKEARLNEFVAHINGFKDLHDRQWFSRVWVLQEVALARSVRILYGTCFLSYRDVYDLSRLNERCSAEVRQYCHEEFKIEFHVSPSLGIIAIARQYVQGGELPNLTGVRTELDLTEQSYLDMINLANMLRTWKCTDQRDRFYALNGILESVHPLWNQTDPKLPVDYNMDVELLYTCAVKCLALRVHSLNFLSGVEDPSQRRLLGLPSWVPDFTAEKGKKSLAPNHRSQAGGQCPFEKMHHVRGKQLLVSSVMVGVVEQLNTPMSGEDEDFVSNLKAITGLASFCLSMSRTYHRGESRVKALWRTFIAGCAQEASPQSSSLSKSFYAYLYKCYRKALIEIYRELNDIESVQDKETVATENSVFDMLRAAILLFNTKHSTLDILALEHPEEVPSTFQITQDILREFLSDILSPSDNTTPQDSWLEMLDVSREFEDKVVYSFGRRMFRSQTGHIGSGPASTRYGDQVHILHNCDIPMVLRPCGTYSNHIGEVLQAYRVIGEVYVHGMMDRKTHDKAFCDSFCELALV